MQTHGELTLTLTQSKATAPKDTVIKSPIKGPYILFFLPKG